MNIKRDIITTVLLFSGFAASGKLRIPCVLHDRAVYRHLPEARIGQVFSSYPKHDGSCTVVLETCAKCRIQFNFADFNTDDCQGVRPGQPTCQKKQHCDYLIIDEPYEKSRRHGLYSGNLRGDSYVSKSSKVSFTFCASEKASTVLRKWTLAFSTFVRSEPWEATLTVHQGVTGQSGTIRSPHFPKYPPSSATPYLLVNKKQQYVYVEFTDLDIEPGVLEIYDGSVIDKETPVTRRYNSDRQPFMSSGPSVYLRFNTSIHSGSVRRGFKANFYFEDDRRTIVKKQMSTRYLMSGKSPPTSYATTWPLYSYHGVQGWFDQVWIIHNTDQTVMIKLVQIHLPKDIYLDIYEGLHTDAPKLTKQGTVRPAQEFRSEVGLYVRYYGYASMKLESTVFTYVVYANNATRKGLGCTFEYNGVAVSGYRCQDSTDRCVPATVVCDGMGQCPQDQEEQDCVALTKAPQKKCHYWFCSRRTRKCTKHYIDCAATTPDPSKMGHQSGSSLMNWIFISAPLLGFLSIISILICIIRWRHDNNRETSRESQEERAQRDAPPAYSECEFVSTVSSTVAFTNRPDGGRVSFSNSQTSLLRTNSRSQGMGALNPSLLRPAPPSYHEVVTGNYQLHDGSREPPPTYAESESRSPSPVPGRGPSSADDDQRAIEPTSHVIFETRVSIPTSLSVESGLDFRQGLTLNTRTEARRNSADVQIDHVISSRPQLVPVIVPEVERRRTRSQIVAPEAAVDRIPADNAQTRVQDQNDTEPNEDRNENT